MRIQRRHNVIFRSACPYQKQEAHGPAGSVSMLVIGVLSLAFALGGYHLYSVNRSAVQGYHMRSAEKEIAALREENADLKIKEADLRSLNRIEAAGEELRMQKADEERYLEAHGPVAMR